MNIRVTPKIAGKLGPISIGSIYWTTQHASANKETRLLTLYCTVANCLIKREEEKHCPPRTLANKQTGVNHKVSETIRNLYRINRL